MKGRKLARYIITGVFGQTVIVKRILVLIKKAFKAVEDSNLILISGSWAFFFLLSAVPLVLLTVMAFDFFGVDVSFLLSDMPTELGEGLSLIVSVATDASKGATFILIVTSLYSSSRLFSYMLKDGYLIYGASRRKNSLLTKAFGFVLMFLVFLVFLLAGVAILLSKKLGLFLSFGAANTLAEKIILNFLVISAAYVIIITLDMFICPLKNKWKAVMLGAFFTLAVAVLGSIGFAAYLHYFASYTDLYGSLTAIVVFMLWVYIVMIGLTSGNVFISLLLKRQESYGSFTNQKLYKSIRRNEKSRGRSDA